MREGGLFPDTGGTHGEMELSLRGGAVVRSVFSVTHIRVDSSKSGTSTLCTSQYGPLVLVFLREIRALP